MIIWFTGLSGSGKTTLSNHLKERLEESGFSVRQVDGDTFRKEQKSKNKFSRQEILENNYRIIDHCFLLRDKYDFIIVAVISPFEKTRQRARKVFRKDYLEIYLDCSLEALVKKDIKGLYAKALEKKTTNMIGFSEKLPYEKPTSPDLVIKTDTVNIPDSLAMIINLLGKKLPNLKIN